MTGVQIALTGIVVLLALRGWANGRGEEDDWNVWDALAGLTYVAAALSIPIGIIIAIWSIA